MPVAWVWIVLIITAGVVLVTMFRARGRREIELPPEHVLKLRFANGQIGEDEYVRRLAVLQHDRLLELED
jgi:uncharacterized membrane protein